MPIYPFERTCGASILEKWISGRKQRVGLLAKR